MKRIICFLLCAVLLAGLMAIPASALSFHVSQRWDTDILAGGILDMYAWVDVGDPDEYTYQWQVDTGFGEGHWYDLEDNADPYGYKGTDTYHLQFITPVNNGFIEGTGWEDIPFRCVVTDKNGESHTTSDIYMHIYTSDDLREYMETQGFGLFEPNVYGATNLKTSDYITYTATSEAGAQLELFSGFYRPENNPLMNRSDLTAELEIWITENGKTVKRDNSTTYTPYTVGSNAVTIQYKLHYTLGVNDMGYYETKTVKLTTTEPEAIGTGTAKYDISLLKEMYNESQKLASIPKGVAVTVTKQMSNWYQVVFNGCVGYVSTSSLNYTPYPQDAVIRHVDLTIPTPVVGNGPAYGCTVAPDSCIATYIDWYDKTGGFYMTYNDRFQEGHSYQLVLWLEALDGYGFYMEDRDTVLTTALINGNLPAFTYKAYEQEIGKVIEVRYDFVNLQEEEEEIHKCSLTYVPRLEPTCTEKGHEAYYRCSCGASYSDSQGQNKVNIAVWGVLPASGHTPSQWRTTQVYHYKVCTTCGEMLPEEDHYGGTATCVEQGKCAVCGYAYLEVNENHTPDTGKWIARIDMYHFHACKDCGAHCDIEDHRWSPTYLYRDDTGHAWVCADCNGHSEIKKHNPGPAATETAPQTCTDCGYILEPAKNHVHELTFLPDVAPTCLASGTAAHYTCSGCTARFSDPEGMNKLPAEQNLFPAPLGHAASDTWEQDGQYHWRTCKNCGMLLEETKMLHEYVNSQCATCGYELPAAPTEPTAAPTEDTPPAEPTQNTAPAKPSAPTETMPTADTSDAPEGSSWGSLLLVALVCFAAAITATVIILKKKK